MKKSEQIKINEKCLNAIEIYNYMASNTQVLECEKLRTCNATVIIYPDYYVLQSYNTIVAIIDRNTDTLYDILRYVYGYTSTSAQHIAKFESDYCSGKYRCEHSYRYYPV